MQGACPFKIALATLYAAVLFVAPFTDAGTVVTGVILAGSFLAGLLLRRGLAFGIPVGVWLVLTVSILAGLGEHNEHFADPLAGVALGYVTLILDPPIG